MAKLREIRHKYEATAMDIKKYSKEVQGLLTTSRKFIDSTGNEKLKKFIPVLQNIKEDEILFIYDIVQKKYTSCFTIDLIKNIPEERIIHFRGTFKISDPVAYAGKGTIYFDSETFEVIFDNLERLLTLRNQHYISQLYQ